MCCTSSSSKDKPSAPETGANPPACAVAPCPVAVTVSIRLSAAVACPGHGMLMKATGTPSGGTYEWAVAGGAAELGDSFGLPQNTGDTVYFGSFGPDNANGNIPEQHATVSVTYTHPNGTATDSKPVKVHKIDFEVTNMVLTAGVTQGIEDPLKVQYGNAPGVPTLLTEPKVRIKLDASCPRKTDCAQNHQVGFLQTITANNRYARYTHTLVEYVLTLPIRDQINGPKPFYQGVTPFPANNRQLSLRHADGPRYPGVWIDPRATATPHSPPPPPAKNQQLRKVFFAMEFYAWLVVQNIEWSAHASSHSFIFLRNWKWSVLLDVAVDTTQPVGSRCTPQSRPPTVGALGLGKGAMDPNLDDPYANQDGVIQVSAAPGI